jgi:hypothetical protein
MVRADILVVKPAYRKSFPIMHPENGQVISSATRWAPRDPCPIHTPKTPTVKKRESPPDSPGDMGGGGGDTQGQSTLMLISGICKEKRKKNGSKPDNVQLFGDER